MVLSRLLVPTCFVLAAYAHQNLVEMQSLSSNAPSDIFQQEPVPSRVLDKLDRALADEAVEYSQDNADLERATKPNLMDAERKAEGQQGGAADPAWPLGKPEIGKIIPAEVMIQGGSEIQVFTTAGLTWYESGPGTQKKPQVRLFEKQKAKVKAEIPICQQDKSACNSFFEKEKVTVRNLPRVSFDEDEEAGGDKSLEREATVEMSVEVSVDDGATWTEPATVKLYDACKMAAKLKCPYITHADGKKKFCVRDTAFHAGQAKKEEGLSCARNIDEDFCNALQKQGHKMPRFFVCGEPHGIDETVEVEGVGEVVVPPTMKECEDVQDKLLKDYEANKLAADVDADEEVKKAKEAKDKAKQELESKKAELKAKQELLAALKAKIEKTKKDREDGIVKLNKEQEKAVLDLEVEKAKALKDAEDKAAADIAKLQSDKDNVEKVRDDKIKELNDKEAEAKKAYEDDVKKAADDYKEEMTTIDKAKKDSEKKIKEDFDAKRKQAKEKAEKELEAAKKALDDAKDKCEEAKKQHEKQKQANKKAYDDALAQIEEEKAKIKKEYDDKKEAKKAELDAAGEDIKQQAKKLDEDVKTADEECKSAIQNATDNLKNFQPSPQVICKNGTPIPYDPRQPIKNTDIGGDTEDWTAQPKPEVLQPAVETFDPLAEGAGEGAGGEQAAMPIDSKSLSLEKKKKASKSNSKAHKAPSKSAAKAPSKSSKSASKAPSKVAPKRKSA